MLEAKFGRDPFSPINTLDVADEEKQVVSIEYWIRLRVPMEQALRLYKVRHHFM